MEDFSRLYSDLWSFFWILCGAFIYAIGGGIIVIFVDLIARLRKKDVPITLYIGALFLSFLIGIFIEWRTTIKTIDDLRVDKDQLTSDKKILEGKNSEQLTWIGRITKQWQDTALENAALKVTKDLLEKDKKRILDSVLDANQPKPYIEITPPLLRADSMLVVFWKNTGFAKATFSSTQVSIFINEQLHSNTQLVSKPLLAIPNERQTFAVPVPASIWPQISDGNAAFSIAMEMKYEGLSGDKYIICYEAQYVKVRNVFERTAYTGTTCKESLKRHS